MTFADYARGLFHTDLARKVGETLITRIGLVAVGAVTSVLITRILGPGGRGEYAVALALGAMGVQLGNLGLHSSNSYAVAKDRTVLPSVVGNSLAVSLIGGTVIGLGIWGFFLIEGDPPVTGPLLLLCVAWIPIGLLYLLLQNILIGVQEIRSYNQIEIVTKSSVVVLVGVMFLGGFVSVSATFAISLFSVAFGGAWAFMRLKNHFSVTSQISVQILKQQFRYGSKAYLAALFSFLIVRASIVMVKSALGAEQTGFYATAINVTDLVYMFPVVVGTILFPQLSSMTSVREQWTTTKEILKIVCIVMAVVSTGGMLFGRLIIEILFGKEFLPSVPALLWLMPGVFFWGSVTIPLQFLAAIGFPFHVVVAWAVLLLASVLLNFLFIPSWGILGAAIAVSAIYTLSFFVFLALASRFAHGQHA